MREDPGKALEKALRHPLRRTLLRCCLESQGAVSPKKLAKLTQEPLSKVSYHVRELLRFGAVELVTKKASRGSVEHFYEPTVLVRETPWVLATLGLSAPG